VRTITGDSLLFISRPTKINPKKNGIPFPRLLEATVEGTRRAPQLIEVRPLRTDLRIAAIVGQENRLMGMIGASGVRPQE